MPLVRRFYFLFWCCYGVWLKRKFPTFSRLQIYGVVGKYLPCVWNYWRGKKKYHFLWIYENRNIDLFCLGFVTLLMIAWCFGWFERTEFLAGKTGAWENARLLLTFSPPPPCIPPAPCSFFFLLNYFFNWIIVDLQCCVSFRYTAKWFSYTYIYLFFQILFHYKLLQNTGYRSLCYTVGPCQLAIFL